MTMIMVLGNRDHIIQLSDRRLSSAGNIITSSFNKATIIKTINGRFSLSFSGLACSGRFDIQLFLLTIIEKILKENSGDIKYLPEKIAELLTTEFNSNNDILKLENDQRRLTVLLAGYLDEFEPSVLALSFISNFTNYENGSSQKTANSFFDAYYIIEKINPREENPTIIEKIGIISALKEQDYKSLRVALENRLPIDKISEIGLGIMRRIADENPITVGDDVMQVIIPREKNVEPFGKYYNKKSTNETFLPDIILSGVNNSLIIKEPTISIIKKNKEQKAFFGKVGRNERCPCGSGKKYKNCHG